ncbi:hypothetical protein [Salinarimonas sp.]|uniref:hypothetical protein n=1 Tax=Salinarimonas sp. TaxID=2766526 RepID=UPI0032D8C72A
MTRTPRLVAAGLILAAAAAALAGLLWIAPGVTPDRRATVEPEITGSLGPRPEAPAPAAAPVAAEAEAALDPATPGVVAPEPAAPPPKPSFAAIRDAGGLRLTGAVPNEADRAAILVAARARFVAEPVIDELAVAEDAEPAPAPVAGLALSALARLAEGEARLAGNAVSLEGRALYGQAVQRIEDEMRLRLPEDWIAKLRLEAPEAAPEPKLAPYPSRAAAPVPPQTEADEATAAGESEGEGATTDAASAGPASTEPAEAGALPPRPQRADLTTLALHPLPPRR